MASSSGERVSRPLGHSLHGLKPKEVINFDFCYIMPSSTGEKYVLILKDDLSSYTWFYACENADSGTAAGTLLEWFAASGVCWKWVSDQGSHLKNEMMK